MNPTRTLHILHLENDPLDAKLIHRAVADAGIPCSFQLVNSRDQFLAELNSEKFDVILSDNRLPDIDGVEALALVRHSNSTTPFIFVSGGNNDPEHVQHLTSLGATAFISKADISRLTAWLQTACNAMAVAPDASYQYVEALERLVTVIQELSLARTLGTVQAIIRSAARALTGADGATFVLRDGDQSFYADEDAIAPLWKGQRFPMSACISGWVMNHRQAAVIEDIYADARFPHDAYRPTFVKSLVMVPIRVRQPLGAIGNYWAHRHAPTAEEVKLLQALADTTSVALENVQVYAELDKRVAERTAELEATNRELESFSSAVSHDLRAPLRHIDGFARILMKDTNTALSGTTGQYLEKIRNASQHMSQLIDDLLKLSRTTRTPAQRQRINLSALASDIVSRLREIEPGRQVLINIGENIEATGDRKLLEIVMENLLSNAWKFTRKKSSAVIEVGSTPTDDGTTAYFVRDNGAGFAMAYSSKLFGVFQRLHSDHDFPGTGIGLATVQRIIHKHGGKVWATAEVGQGACFFFTLGAESTDAL